MNSATQFIIPDLTQTLSSNTNDPLLLAILFCKIPQVGAYQSVLHFPLPRRVDSSSAVSVPSSSSEGVAVCIKL